MACIVAQHTGTDLDQVTPGTIIGDLKGDSIDHVELVMACEDEFAVEIDDDEWATVANVQQLVDLIVKKGGGQ